MSSRQHRLPPAPETQAVSSRRPLRRRPAMMARPARVRMRNRKPWVRARRRLFGWKVRLPFATATTPSCPSRSRPPSLPSPNHDACDVLRRISPLVLLTRHRRGTYGILGFIPDDVRVAAVPPTFGRLFEGTDLLDAGQTDHRRHTRIPSAQESVTFTKVVIHVFGSVGGAIQKLLASANAVSTGRMHRNHPHWPMPIAVGHRLAGPRSR